MNGPAADAGLLGRLAREPLVHFAFVGGLLFAGWSAISRDEPRREPRDELRIGPGDVAWLEETWTRQWQRKPTAEELNALVCQYVREELLAREARAMGLDEKDTIVRRRLAQKVEFLVEDTSRAMEPTDADLARFCDAHPELVTSPARVSFEQVAFVRGARTDPAADARAALLRLRSPAGAAPPPGDPLPFPASAESWEEATLAAQFGAGFAREVFATAPGAWAGPVESAFGAHLVRVTELVPQTRRPLAEARDRVVEHWRAEREREAQDRFLAELSSKYAVVVDPAVSSVVGEVSVRTAADGALCRECSR